jgi:hypothetical protein
MLYLKTVVLNLLPTDPRMLFPMVCKCIYHTCHCAPDILELDAANRTLHLLACSRSYSMHSACVVLLYIPNGHIAFVPEKKRPSCMYELERVLNVLTALDKNGEHHALLATRI